MRTNVSGITFIGYAQNQKIGNPNKLKVFGSGHDAYFLKINLSGFAIFNNIFSIFQGYTGPTCNDDINECNTGTSVCGPGTCFNHEGYFSCQCPQGFDGQQCQNVSIFSIEEFVLLFTRAHKFCSRIMLLQSLGICFLNFEINNNN